MKIILFLALITLATCELYHYQECVRGTTVLLKEPCSSGTYEGNSPFHPLADDQIGYYRSSDICCRLRQVSVTSTGMGCPSATIAAEELINIS